MTVVNIAFTVPSGTATGSLVWTPVAITGNPSLPAPQTVALDGTGAESVTLTPNDSTWVWRVDEQISGVDFKSFYVNVPNTTSVSYKALVQVDPATGKAIATVGRSDIPTTASQSATALTGTLDARYQQPGASTAAFMSRLNGGKESVSMLVMGDSTGDETNVQGRWVLLTAQWLASKFPAYTVNFRQWNSTSDNWDSLGTGQSRVIQTGTGTGNAGGPFVIDVWNSSASGQAPAYHYNVTRWGKITTSGPYHLVIINHGHNNGGASGAQAAYEINKLAQSARDKWPLAGVLLTAQNPTNAQADTANDYLRARAVQSLAGIEGYGLVNIFQTFIASGSYTSLLLDGLHPNAMGSGIWRDEVVKHFNTNLSAAVAPRNTPPAQNRLWVPASSFGLYAGSATYGLVNNENFMWSFPTGSISSVVASVDMPAHWTQYDTYLYWTVAGSSGYTGSTLVSWALWRQTQAASSSLPTGAFPQAPGSWVGPTQVNINPNNGSAYQSFIGMLSQQSTSGLGAPLGLRVERRGGNGTDNIAENAYMLGVMLVKAGTAL